MKQKPLYELGQLLEFSRTKNDLKPERELVKGILTSDDGYSYKLSDGTFVLEGSVFKAYVLLSKKKKTNRKTVEAVKQRTFTPEQPVT